MTNNSLELSVFEIVGSPFCVASDDGQKVYERLAAALRAGHGVRLSFHNVAIVTSAFLNAAIGQLYGEFDEAQIRARLQVSDIAPDDVMLLRRVVETAKQYFTDPQTFVQAIQEAQGGDGDD